MAPIRLRISAFFRILFSSAFSTFRILPRRGKIAWKRRSRPPLAEPPAELPSTMNSSLSEGSCDEQSASLPGRSSLSSGLLRRTMSRALRAASRARAASAAFSTMVLPILGFSSRNSANFSPTTAFTAVWASLLSSLTLACDSNCGSPSLTDTTQ